MWKAIDLTKIDTLLKEFEDYKSDSESFSSFIENTRDDEIPIWDWVDSIGVITPRDFESNFEEDFIKEHFEELAKFWFNGLQAQIDFGIVSDCVKDEMGEKNGK